MVFVFIVSSKPFYSSFEKESFQVFVLVIFVRQIPSREVL